MYQTKIFFFKTKLQPSLKHDLCLSLSQAQVGNMTSFQARAEHILDIQLAFGPNQSLAQIQNLLVSRAKPANFVFFGSSGLELQQASLTLSWITLQRLVKMGHTRTKISKLINACTNWTIQSTWIQMGSCGSSSAHVGKTTSAQKRGEKKPVKPKLSKAVNFTLSPS